MSLPKLNPKNVASPSSILTGSRTRSVNVTPVSNWQSGNTGGSENHVRQGWPGQPGSVASKVKQSMASRQQNPGYIGSHSKPSGKHHATPVNAANVLNSTQLGSSSTYTGKHTASGQAFAAHNAKFGAMAQASGQITREHENAQAASKEKADKAKADRKAARPAKIAAGTKQGIALGIALSSKHKGNNQKMLEHFVK